MKVELKAITEADIPAVAAFLHTNLNSRVSAQTWARAMIPPWPVESPNHGYLLRADAAVVGAYLTFYSRRRTGGDIEDFCNLGAWCVKPEYRLHSLRLMRALITQDGYTFTDLSPSGNVVDLNVRSGFQTLPRATALLPNLPWPSIPGRIVISSDPRRIAAALDGPQLQIFQDHRRAAAAHHLLIRIGDQTCYVVFRRDRRKQLPLFASLLYASDPQVLRQALRPLTRHLLIRHRLLATLLEERVMSGPPRWAISLKSPRTKMYKSSRLAPDQIDNLYSELVCVPW